LLDNPLAIEEFRGGKADEHIGAFCQERGAPDLLVLVGHSYGAKVAARIANDRRVKRQVDLLILIDPFPGIELKPGVARQTVNFYTDRGPAGVHGEPIVGARNHFFGGTVRCPLNRCSQGRHHLYDHMNIDDCDYVQKRILDLIQALFPD
jgi:pimeloyl-ACP methyl ester carboxylesterase